MFRWPREGKARTQRGGTPIRKGGVRRNSVTGVGQGFEARLLRLGFSVPSTNYPSPFDGVIAVGFIATVIVPIDDWKHGAVPGRAHKPNFDPRSARSPDLGFPYIWLFVPHGAC